MTLNDSNQKKVAFMRQAAIELGMRNVSTYEGRVETWRPATRFAVVISRAFADLAQFIDKCRHLVAPGGVLAAMKGVAPSGHSATCRVVELKVPLLAAQRHLLLCEVGG
jgi:16S rRNA (guanine527-N7)-methyltransferase